MKWKVISASVRGSSHQRSGLPNQDAVDHATAGRDESVATVLAVADGHGGARYFRSQVGSTLAVHTAVRLVGEFMTRSETPATELAGRQLCSQIVSVWSAAVLSDLSNNPFTEAELSKLAEVDSPASRDAVIARPELAYGATLLAVAILGDRVLYLQLGDGDILTVGPDGATTRPIAADERLVGNQTTSLCQPDAEREFRIAATESAEALPVAVLLSTDGYLNSFRSEEDFLQIGQDYLQILREQGSETLAQELPNILAEATEQGSGDDITLGIVHRDVLRPTAAAVVAVAEVIKPSASKSAIIEKLKTEHSSQQKKLSELATHYEGVQKNLRQLRILLVGVVVLAIAIFATQHYWWPLLKGGGDRHPVPKLPVVPVGTLPQTTPGKEPVIPTGDKNPPLPPVEGDTPGVQPKSQPKPQPEPDKKSHYLLNLSDGRQIPLSVGKTILVDDLNHDTNDAPYAKVKKQDGILKLTNLSHDVWTASMPGAKAMARFNTGDSLPLRENLHITFGKSTNVVVTLQ